MSSTPTVPAHKRANHVKSTGVMLGRRTLTVPSRPRRHRRIPPHVRETVAWWVRSHYRLLRALGVDRTIARSIARSHAHCAYLATQENSQ